MNNEDNLMLEAHRKELYKKGYDQIDINFEE